MGTGCTGSKSKIEGYAPDSAGVSHQPASSASVPPRPVGAVGTFLRIITVNDVYTLDNYPRVAAAVDTARAATAELDCLVMSCMNGDFLSPCTMTALDGGQAMAKGLGMAKIDYVCLGNHEFDVGYDKLKDQLQYVTGKVVNSNVEVAQLAHLPRYEIVKVGARTVIVGGFCISDKSIYTFPIPTITPTVDACHTVWNDAKEAIGSMPDLFLPMTHQFIADDKATANALADHPDLGSRTPCILGGHEHEPFIEKAGKSLIVKVGQDASLIGIVDIWWTEDGNVQCKCNTLKATMFAQESKALAFVQSQNELLNSMMSEEIIQLDNPMSTKDVRFASSALASVLLSYVKRGLTLAGVEIVLLNAANIRGRADYDAGPFTMGDLYKENPWENEMAIVNIPGNVLVESIRFSRAGEGAKARFLHADSDVEISVETHELIKIDGKVVVPDRLYKVAIIVHLLTGMDSIKPLTDYVAESKLKIPHVECCKPSKQVVMTVCMRDQWRKFLGYDATKPETHERISPDELNVRTHQVLKTLDENADGRVSKEECVKFLKSRGSYLVAPMIAALDADGDGRISAHDFASLVQ